MEVGVIDVTSCSAFPTFPGCTPCQLHLPPNLTTPPPDWTPSSQPQQVSIIDLLGWGASGARFSCPLCFTVPPLLSGALTLGHCGSRPRVTHREVGGGWAGREGEGQHQRLVTTALYGEFWHVLPCQACVYVCVYMYMYFAIYAYTHIYQYTYCIYIFYIEIWISLHISRYIYNLYLYLLRYISGSISK